MNKSVISSTPDSIGLYLKKIWQNKSLVLTLAKRDLKTKYAQTLLGLAWTIVQPMVAVVVYTLFFSGLLNFETEYPYVLFVLSGMLIWGFFNYVFSQGSNALAQNKELIKKLAFPKIILPGSKIILAFVEFLITLVLLFAIMIYYQVDFKLSMLLAPLILIPLIFFSLGLSLILSALTLKKRDLFHVIPFLVNFGIWVTPVFYPVTLIPEQFKNMIFINPIASVIQLFRWSFFGESLNSYIIIGVSLSFLTFIIGFFLFKKQEDQIIDII